MQTADFLVQFCFAFREKDWADCYFVHILCIEKADHDNFVHLKGNMCVYIHKYIHTYIDIYMYRYIYVYMYTYILLL